MSKTAAEHEPIARVLPMLSVPHLDRDFDYLVSAEQSDDAQPGVRVRVRFHGRLVDAFILERRSETDHVGKLGFLDRVVSAERVLTPDSVDKATHVGRRHLFGGHHPIQESQFADMVCLRASFEDEGIDQAAVEPHPDTHARLRVVRLLSAHEIVEVAVQVRHRQHRQHPGDRLVLRRGLGHPYRLADGSDVLPKRNPAVIPTSDVA